MAVPVHRNMNVMVVLNLTLNYIMNLSFNRLLTVAFAGFCGATAMAVPARQVVQEMLQPDSTTVSLTLTGDEVFHCFMTQDGYPADRDSSGFFRLIGNDGNLTMIPVAATGDSGSEYAAEVSRIDPAAAFDASRRLVTEASAYVSYRENLARRSRQRLSSSLWDNADGHDLRKFPNEGEQKILVILVSFADLDWSFSDNPHADMTAMLNEPRFDRFNCTGSARDFFMESSNGIFRPQFDVYGPVKLPENCIFYGENTGFKNDVNPARMVLDACELLDDEVDFSQYDRDGDGVIDNVYVFYAGYGENEGAESWRIWPHAWDVRYSSEPIMVLDGVQVGHYACSNEKVYSTNIMTGIGTMCHEFSHVLGLPDLYATSYTGALTPGEYSCMDQGSYNNNGRTPPLYSAYERYAVEWQKPVDITTDEEITMLPLSAHGNTYRVTIDPERPWEYYLFENRQKSGFDSFLPGHGMLVWHINYDESLWKSNIVNDDPTDQHVDLVEADAVPGLSTLTGDPFPGSGGVFSFLGDGEPAFANRHGAKSPFDITHITEEADGAVTIVVGEGRQGASEFEVASPQVRMDEIGSDYFILSVTDVSDNGLPARNEEEEAERMYISVCTASYDDDTETFRSDPLKGYSFLEINAGEPVRVAGVEPSTAYSVRIYRSNELNASKPSPLTVVTSAEGVSGSRPVASLADVNTIDWTAIADAEYYLLTVAIREEEESTAAAPVTFDSRKVPSGWDFMGSFSSSAGTFGASAPSLVICEDGDYLKSPYYEDSITSVSIWAVATGTSQSRLDIYSFSSETSIYPIGELAVPADGGAIELSDIPEGVHRIAILPNVGTGNEIYVDDVVLGLAGKVTDSPVAGYDEKRVESTREVLSGLAEGGEYVAYVKAGKGAETGQVSNSVRFVAGPSASVARVADGHTGFVLESGIVRPVDPELTYDVFTVAGATVARAHKGNLRLPARGTYIIRTAATATKVVW